MTSKPSRPRLRAYTLVSWRFSSLALLVLDMASTQALLPEGSSPPAHSGCPALQNISSSWKGQGNLQSVPVNWPLGLNVWVLGLGGTSQMGHVGTHRRQISRGHLFIPGSPEATLSLHLDCLQTQIPYWSPAPNRMSLCTWLHRFDCTGFTSEQVFCCVARTASFQKPPSFCTASLCHGQLLGL